MEDRVARLKPLLLIAMAALALAACRGRARDPAKVPTAATQTIPPASAKPAPNGSDAMTQTVEVEDSRSVDEGGALADKPGAKLPATPPAKAKKKTRK